MRFATGLFSILLGVAVTATLFAQPPQGGPPRPEGPPRDGERAGPPRRGDREGPPRGREGDRPGPPRGGEQGHRFPPMPILMALDADNDGEISAKEIENAAAALKTLDKNEDGKLTPEELRPEFGRRGGPDGFRGRPDGPPREGDRRGGPRDGAGPPRERPDGEGNGERPRRPRRPEA